MKSRNIIENYPNYNFISGDQNSWSPESNTITYTDSPKLESSYSLLHEIAHAELKHTRFETDLELIIMEEDAWHHAQTLAKKHRLKIPDTHIDTCINSYRDWLYERSLCPLCKIAGFQPKKNIYRCHNCQSTWQVPGAQMCNTKRVLVN